MSQTSTFENLLALSCLKYLFEKLGNILTLPSITELKVTYCRLWQAIKYMTLSSAVEGKTSYIAKLINEGDFSRANQTFSKYVDLNQDAVTPLLYTPQLI